MDSQDGIDVSGQWCQTGSTGATELMHELDLLDLEDRLVHKDWHHMELMWQLDSKEMMERLVLEDYKNHLISLDHQH